MEGGSLEHLLAGLLLLLLLLLLLYVCYSGALHPITVRTLEPTTGPLTLAYKTLVGPYSGAGRLYSEAYSLLPHRQQLGIYYDDPASGQEEHELRCAVGPLLALGEQEPEQEEVAKCREQGWNVVTLPPLGFVVSASHPFTTSLSVHLATWRLYPALRSYIAARRLCAYPALELALDREVVVMLPLSRQEEYTVTEFVEDSLSVTTTDVEGQESGSSSSRDSSCWSRVTRSSARLRRSSEVSRQGVAGMGEKPVEDQDLREESSGLSSALTNRD